MNFLASPTIVTAMAFSGRLSFNPMTDTLETTHGEFRFHPPKSDDLPSSGFERGNPNYYPIYSPEPQPETEIVVSPSSQRLQILQPFKSHFGLNNSRGLELPKLNVLMRIRGKCTTDHISAAGPWLKYKGHLENISENLLITAINDEGGEVNVAYDPTIEGGLEAENSIPKVAQAYKSRGQPWALIVDENYGEGSAREHAALQPRFYGCSLIVAKSFARIHESNLKKQGILPLWFCNKEDYSLIGHTDTIETQGLEEILQGSGNSSLTLRVTRKTGETLEVQAYHTLSQDQIQWLREGSALNYIRKQLAKR